MRVSRASSAWAPTPWWMLFRPRFRRLVVKIEAFAISDFEWQYSKKKL